MGHAHDVGGEDDDDGDGDNDDSGDDGVGGGDYGDGGDEKGLRIERQVGHAVADAQPHLTQPSNQAFET